MYTLWWPLNELPCKSTIVSSKLTRKEKGKNENMATSKNSRQGKGRGSILVLSNTTPGFLWYLFSIMMAVCTLSSIKTRVVYQFWGIKKDKIIWPQLGVTRKVLTQHDCNISCTIMLNSEMYRSYVTNTSATSWYVAWVSWYTNFSSIAQYSGTLLWANTDTLISPQHQLCPIIGHVI